MRRFPTCRTAARLLWLLAGALLLLVSEPVASQDPKPAPGPVAAAPKSSPASLDTEPFRERVVQLYRATPFLAAKGEALYEIEDLGQLKGQQLAVTSREVFFRDKAGGNTRELVSAKSVPHFVADKSGAVQPEVKVPDEGRATLLVALSEFSQAGEFVTGFTLRSPALSKPEKVNLIVRVSDHWVWPFGVILAGVLISSLVNHLTGRWRPSQEVRFRLTRLRADLLGLDEASVKNAQRLGSLQTAREAVRRAEERMVFGDLEKARAQLEQAETALTEYRKEEVKLRAALRQKLGEVERQLDGPGGLRARLPADRADELRPVTEFLARARDLLAKNFLDDAEAALQEAASRQQALAATLPQARTLERAVAPGLRIKLVEPQNPTTDDSITFRAEVPPPAVAEGGYSWEFGDGVTQKNAPGEVQHRYQDARTYTVRVTVAGGGTPPTAARSATLEIEVAPGRTDRELKRIQSSILYADLLLAALGVLLGALTGLTVLYSNEKTFGTLNQYIVAFLWGCGADTTLRGFAENIKKLKP